MIDGWSISAAARRRLIGAVVGLFVFLSAASYACACRCLQRSAQRHMASAELVFWGTAVDRGYTQPTGKRFVADLVPHAVYKGEVDDFTLRFTQHNTSCKVGFDAGTSYLVFAAKDPREGWTTHLCSGTSRQSRAPKRVAGTRPEPLGLLDELWRVPGREAPSKLRWEVAQTRRLLADAKPSKVNTAAAIAMLEHLYKLDACGELLEAADQLRAYHKSVEASIAVDALRADCRLRAGQWREGLERAVPLAKADGAVMSLHSVRRDLLAWGNEPVDERNTFDQYWAGEQGEEWRAGAFGARQLLIFMRERRHYDTPVVLEAIADLLAADQSGLAEDAGEWAIYAYLRAAAASESNADRYRDKARALLANDENIDDFAWKLEKKLEAAREERRDRTTSAEAEYAAKLAERAAAERAAAERQDSRPDAGAPVEDDAPQRSEPPSEPEVDMLEQASDDTWLHAAAVLGLILVLGAFLALIRRDS